MSSNEVINDTNEIVKEIKVKTDNLPTDPATEDTLGEMTDILEEINEKTTNLPNDPADQSLLEQEFAEKGGIIYKSDNFHNSNITVSTTPGTVFVKTLTAEPIPQYWRKAFLCIEYWLRQQVATQRFIAGNVRIYNGTSNFVYTAARHAIVTDECYVLGHATQTGILSPPSKKVIDVTDALESIKDSSVDLSLYIANCDVAVAGVLIVNGHIEYMG